MNIALNTNLHGDAEELEESLLRRPEQLEHFPALTCQLDCLAQCPPEILLQKKSHQAWHQSWHGEKRYHVRTHTALQNFALERRCAGIEFECGMWEDHLTGGHQRCNQSAHGTSLAFSGLPH